MHMQADFVGKQPLLKFQLRELIWKKESEVTMVEALVKLGSVTDVVLASLETHGHHTGSQGSQGPQSSTKQGRSGVSRNGASRGPPSNSQTLPNITLPGPSLH
jgi:hypothetical protein